MDKLPLHPLSTHLLIRHHEISLKGKNRPQFERRLIRNLNLALENKARVEVASGRMLIDLSDELRSKKTIEKISNVSGVVAVTPCFVTSDLSTENIETCGARWLQTEVELNPEIKSFAVRSKRIEKRSPLTSNELDRRISERFLNLKGPLKVNLKKPDLKLTVEVRQKHALFYSSEHAGLRGLPIDSQQRVACLLSGGIDSPVAVFEMMRRGCNPVLLHFHSMPFTSQASEDKVLRLSRVLRKFSPYPLEFWSIPLLEIQKAVRDQCNERYRTIHYRRFMLRIAQELARRRGAQVLVTGDSLNQVASQTLVNMCAIESAVQMPVLRPLVTAEKAVIIEKAQKLGTYETSLEPHDDTCILFAPERPTTRANPSYLIEEEQRLPVYQLVFAAVDAAKLTVI